MNRCALPRLVRRVAGRDSDRRLLYRYSPTPGLLPLHARRLRASPVLRLLPEGAASKLPPSSTGRSPGGSL